MTAESSDGKIECKIDGARVHSIQVHISRHHKSSWSVERYQKEFPGEPLMSAMAEKAVAEARKSEIARIMSPEAAGRKPLHIVFGLPEALGKSPRGDYRMVRVNDVAALDEQSQPYVPDVDPNYVFEIEVLRNVIIGYEMNKTLYLHGLHGSGKTTLLEQVAARTKRPFFRLQHTVNTEEAHVLGQWTVQNGETVFSLGPLPLAMKHGWVYCADEYDFALPSVTSVYQSVLEGKQLVIKEAPPELRVIRPHPDFRFVATGNTNGCGDETGLYQGTQIQNAANYSRFAITIEVEYPAENIEAAIISGQAGIQMDEAKKLVKFATEVRKSFKGNQISATVSPRELINAGFLGHVRGGDWRGGLMLAFANRLSRTDREVVSQFSQRIFG